MAGDSDSRDGSKGVSPPGGAADGGSPGGGTLGGTGGDTAGGPGRGRPTPLRLLGTFAWINTVTLGGGYVIVPVTGRALERRGWMAEDRFYAIFAKAQAFPGPLALSTSMLSGYELCGRAGAAAGFFGVVAPPFLAILVVSRLLSAYGSLPAVERFLDGAGAVVPGIVGAMVWKNFGRLKKTAPRLVELAALTVLLVLFPSLNLPILLSAIAAMYLLEGLWTR